MKKFLLLTAALMLGMTANAENTSRVFSTYHSDYYGSDMSLSGLFRGVSGNGKYAVGYDDGVFDFISYIWNADKPDELEYFRFNCYMYDVADDGTVVGARLFKQDVNSGGPAIYKDGVWTDLPMHETCIGTDPGTNTAVRISPDGKYICGMLFCEHAAGGNMKIYPCLWTRNDESGEYELTMYNNLDLPDHQGFIVYDMSDDGRYIVGRVFTGFGSTIPAYIKDGKFNIFNELTEETYIEEWDTNGDGQFTPDDPESMDMYIETTDWYIDGVKDEAQCDGQIMSVDNNGNMIGWITILDPEDGSAYNTGFIYNEEKHSSIVELPYMFGCVMEGDNCLFVSDGAQGPVYYMQGAEAQAVELSSAFGVSDASYSLVTEVSADGKVIIGGTVLMGEVSMNQPFIITLDESCGIQQFETQNGKIIISAGIGEINVTGADNIAIYSLNGTLMSNNANTQLPAGIYIVKADDKVAKVAVK